MKTISVQTNVLAYVPEIISVHINTPKTTYHITFYVQWNKQEAQYYSAAG